MKRRDALKLIATAAISSALPRELWAIARQVHEQVAGSTPLRTLSPHQNQTVITIAELIIPQTDTPGAKAARVNEFIDLILTEWSEDEERRCFLAGLSDLDARSRDLFGKDFVDCPSNQQGELLSVLDGELASVRESIVPGTLKRGRTTPPEEHFFYMMKRMTLLGYYTSEIGAQQELAYEIIPSGHAGCVPFNGRNGGSGR